MTTHRDSAVLHYRRALAPRHRRVDKKGLAVALIFLIAASLWGMWRIQQTAQPVFAWHEELDLSATVDMRQGIKSVLEEETVQPVQPLPGLPAALQDPRQAP